MGEPYETTVTEIIYAEEEYQTRVNDYERVAKEIKAYELLEPVNGGNKKDAEVAINRWRARNTGTDWEEGGFFALHQAATSGRTSESVYATGFDTQWREDADMKLIVFFGDAQSHTDSIDQQETIDALRENNIIVAAINVDTITETFREEHPNNLTATENGIDGSGQASAITTATNGEYSDVDNNVLLELLSQPSIDYSGNYCSIAESLDLVCTILGSVGNTAVVTTTENTYTNPTVNLDFRSAEEIPGLTVTYTCTDPLGCNDVSNGESRTFQMTVVGNIPGSYTFNTATFDVDTNTNVTGAIADNHIIIYSID